ncbi:MAG TPA: hypothetical protein VE223_00545 [Nitrososphaeraceae archaeon]|nr:hypothetical protein [Nitrososphaeraceae archaeon]
MLDPKQSSKITMMIVVAIVVILVVFISTYATPPRPVYTMLFSSASNLSHSGNFSISLPDIATYGNNVYVVWTGHNAGSSNIYFKASKNSGASFASQENLSSNNTGSSQSPRIAVSHNNVYVVWEYNIDGHHNILFKKSTNSGASFASQENLSSNNTGSSFSPLVSTTGNDVYVIWQDVTDRNSDIYFKASKNGGASFGNTINLSHDVGFSGSPQVAANGNDAHVVWQGISAGNSDVYFKSIRGGNTLANTITLSHDVGFSGSPQIIISVHNIYLVWTENISGHSDVYFKRARWSMIF